VSTSAERASLDALREATGERGGPMERHGIRVFLIVERLASKEGATVDREVLLCASLLHDVGLYPRASEGGAYVTDGRHYAAGVLVSGRWSGDRLERCLDAIELHHELRPQWERGAEVELLRRADLVEVSAGLVRFGLRGGWLRGLFRAVPRAGFYPEIARLLGRALRERPATLPRIFVVAGA
jgi:hypothetical protein